ncbi:UNKNOWN [Stylonychia lemnae]|uniref:Uncharacterized protein n=1 Tax=Stylonychia lemnae TaxID=5949 RepID=A0A078AA99_STYLE|nr:UNKNOWN [Stylonychia lemnae]|eukprot:CDW78502.1 UNKNOWN [Stylonychia lemnae]
MSNSGMNISKDTLNSALLPDRDEDENNTSGLSKERIDLELDAENKKQQGSQWIWYSLSAAIICAVCNSMISELSVLGFEGLLYLQPGATFSGLMFFLYLSARNHLNHGNFSPEISMKNESSGKIEWQNLIQFLLYALVYLTYQSLVVLTFNFSLQANVNPGLVSTIWATTPLFAGFLDYMLFGQRLTMKHFIGVICLTVCVACISITPVIYSADPNDNLKTQTMQPWVPVTLALISPIFFATSNIQTKFLTTKKNFDSFKLSFGAFTFVGIILTCFLIPKFWDPNFNLKNLLIGSLGSILNSIGLSLIAQACATGPIGPAVSLVNLNTIIFTIIEAFKLWKFPKGLEIFGLAIGFTGAMVLSMPDQMERLFRFLTCKK